MGNSTSEHAYKVEELQVVGKVGRGAFGEVWKVYHAPSSQYLALKCMSKAEVFKQKMVEHVVLERRILAVCLDHPYVVTIRNAFQTARSLYILMDYLPGGSLLDILRAKGAAFTEDEARFYVCEIVLALQFLHTNRIVYRDLKLENLLLDEQGHVVVTDFGLSGELGEDGLVHSFSGTAIYLAPEVLADKEGVGHNQSVDWWALGVLLFFLLTEEPPFWHENRAELFQLITNTEPNPNKIAHLSANAIDFLLGLLNKDPAKRLGMCSKGVETVMAHSWFEGVDWSTVEARSLAPPFRIQVSKGKPSANSTHNLSLTSQEVALGDPFGEVFVGFDGNASSVRSSTSPAPQDRSVDASPTSALPQPLSTRRTQSPGRSLKLSLSGHRPLSAGPSPTCTPRDAASDTQHQLGLSPRSKPATSPGREKLMSTSPRREKMTKMQTWDISQIEGWRSPGRGAATSAACQTLAAPGSSQWRSPTRTLSPLRASVGIGLRSPRPGECTACGHAFTINEDKVLCHHCHHLFCSACVFTPLQADTSRARLFTNVPDACLACHTKLQSNEARMRSIPNPKVPASSRNLRELVGATAKERPNE